MSAEFLADDELGYGAIRSTFAAGEALRLDEAYRLAQLPLLAPDHPDAIASVPGSDYRHGRYDRPRRSLVVPMPADAIHDHPLLQALRASRLGPRIDWGLIERRRDRLHVTVATVDRAPPVLPPPFRLRVGGPLIGDRNRGRIYLACYPQRTPAGDPLAALQRACGIRPNGRYLLGLINLVDHLDAGETETLGRLLDHDWRHGPSMVVTVDHLALLETHDDLALCSSMVRLPLSELRGDLPMDFVAAG